jgi:hypothetical protein
MRKTEILSAQRPHKTEKKNVVWKVMVILFLVVGILVGCVYFLLNSSLFKVESMKVSGVRLTAQHIIMSSFFAESTREKPWLSFFGPDHILFWKFAPKEISPSYVSTVERIIRDVNFGKKQVSFLVTERLVTNVLCEYNSGKCYGMDENGFVFSSVPEVRGSLILRFEAGPGEHIMVGKQYLTSPLWTKNIMNTISLMESEGFVPKLVRVKRDSIEEWEALMQEGFSFYFSLHFIPENLQSVLKDIALKTRPETIEYFDFRVENRVYYK